MGEGLLEGALGGEAEEGEAAAAIGKADGVAMAVAMDAARYDPELARRAGDYLDEQRALAALQARHYDAEQQLALQAARRKRFSDRMKNGLQALLVMVVLLIVVGVVDMVVDAVRSRAVVVEPFSVPPALVAQGLTGNVVATAVIDRLTELQDATRSGLARRQVSSGWAGDIKVEVPETGVSIGELDRLLRERLGHDTLVTGELTQAADGRLSLTVRGDEMPARTFSGGADDAQALAKQAGEYLFSRAEPLVFTTYLRNSERNDEAVAFSAAQYAAAKPKDQAVWLGAWGRSLVSMGRYQEAEAKLLATLDLAPDNWGDYATLINMWRVVGEEERAAQLRLAMLRRVAAVPDGRKPTRLELLPVNPMVQDWSDYLGAVEDTAAFAGRQGLQTITAPALFTNAYTQLHDWKAAERSLLLSPEPTPDVAVAEGTLRGREALEAGRPADAIPPLEAAAAKVDSRIAGGFAVTRCWLGLAYELADQPANAKRAFAGPRLQACESFRADGAEHRGDRAAADAGYAAAVAVAPSLPFAYQRWGLALLARGDLARAAQEFALANARGPHWADPLKGAGDVLARQGRWKEALAKYDAALPLAPHWAALLAARDAAARNR